MAVLFQPYKTGDSLTSVLLQPYKIGDSDTPVLFQPCSKKTRSLRHVARQFLLMWSCFGTRVIRDMTLHSAPSFGEFILLDVIRTCF